MNLGVSILYQKSVPEDPGPFSFLKPLDTKGWIQTLFLKFQNSQNFHGIYRKKSLNPTIVWLSIAIAFAMVSAGYFVVSQVSPDPDGPVSKVLSTIT